MNKLTREFLLWALDNFQSSATGVPLNWRHALPFDHGADGIKTGTGRAGTNNGFLVRDLDGK
ncbi:hypothetical protein [Hydrogenophaga sp. BPS33]|uniref:hypothetical protein n=1 Tax=Hydrogenophaga sp. BPS33 TaxID=2651974 RepID=UPI00131F8EEC|nr:hypothetical protein [Hydrogenophaga sp. BPS33]QHE85154.1 hypothetical protein F9K07_09780 [Hydrogenophaga sp. BPS33]